MAAGDDVRQQLDDLQRDLWRSAEIGKTLLAENEELHAELECMRKEHASQLEALVQEKHELNMKLCNATRMEAAYREEIESLRDMVVGQRALAERDVSSRHAEQLSLLQQKLSDASSRIKDMEAAGQAAADERAMLEARLETLLEQKRRESFGDKGRPAFDRNCTDGSISMCNRDDDETNVELGLQQQLDSALQCQIRLQEELEKTEARVAAAEALTRRQAEQCITLRADIEDAQSQASSFSFALEKQRQENQDLRAELDMIRLMSQDHKAKGNSLFAELEDKRLEAEKRIVSLLVENKSLAAQSEQCSRQLRTLKVQLANVLRETSSSVDAAHVGQLERRLAEAMARNEELVLAVQRFESEEAHQARLRLCQAATGTASSAASSLTKSIAEATGMCGAQPAKAASAVVDISYTQALLKSKDTQLDKLRAELQAKRYELLAESSRLQESERRLRDLDGLVAKLRAENVQLCVRLEDAANARPSAAAAVAPMRSDMGSNSAVAVATPAPTPAQRDSRHLASAADDRATITPAAARADDVEKRQLLPKSSLQFVDGKVAPNSSLPGYVSSVQRTDSVVPANICVGVTVTCAGPANAPQALGLSSAESAMSSLVPPRAHCLSSDRQAASGLSLEVPRKSDDASSSACLSTQLRAGLACSRSVANPRTAARLAKMEAGLHAGAGDCSRSAAATAVAPPVAPLQPKLTARASASSASAVGASSLLPKLSTRTSASSSAASTSLSTLDDSASRNDARVSHCEFTPTGLAIDSRAGGKYGSSTSRAEEVMKEVCSNVPMNENTTRSQQGKPLGQGQTTTAREPGLQSVPTCSDVTTDQENCPVQ